MSWPHTKLLTTMRLTWLFLLIFPFVQAQDILDPNFAEEGKLQLAAYDYHEVAQMKTLNDGSVVVLASAGRITDDGYDNDLMIAKFSQEGDVNTAFGTQGYLTTDFQGYDSSLGADFLELPGGNILVLGYGFNFSETGVRPTLLMLVTADGEVVTAFGTGGVLEVSFLGESNTAYSIHLDDENRILIAAASNDPVDGAGTVAVLGRLTDALELDLSFGGTGKIEVDPNQGVQSISNAKVNHASSTAFTDVITLEDGSIYAVGSTYNFYLLSYIVKLKEDGTLDSNFYENGIYTWESTPIINSKALKIEQLSSGALLVILKTEESENDFTFLKIENNLVTSYSYDVAGQQDFLEQIVEDEEGNIFLTGRSVDNDKYNSASYAHHYSVIKLTHDFSVNTTYGANGVLTFEWDGINQAGANEGILADDGGLILAGEVYEEGLTAVNVGVVKVKKDVTITSTDRLELEESIDVFPNPFQQVLNIRSKEVVLDVFVTDQMGRKTTIPDFDTGKIALTELNPGIYFLHLKLSQGSITKKIIKNR